MKAILCTLALFTVTSAFASDGATTEMCTRAIEQTTDSLDTSRSVVEKNLAGGHITQADYDKATTMLDQVQEGLDMNTCMASTGNDLKVYKCLSRYGDFIGCLKP